MISLLACLDKVNNLYWNLRDNAAEQFSTKKLHPIPCVPAVLKFGNMFSSQQTFVLKCWYENSLVWPDMAICRHFGNFGRCLVTIFCQKSPVHKSFDEDILASIFLCILGFGKFIYVLCRQIWRFLPKCWQLFGLNTWSHWMKTTDFWHWHKIVTHFLYRNFNFEITTS